MYHVRRCVKMKENETETLIAPGGVLVVESDKGKKKLQLRDGTLSDESIAVLSLLFPDVRPAHAAVSDDETCGTPKRQPVGGRWPVNAATIANVYCNAAGDAIRKEDVEGELNVAEAVRVGPVDCLRIQGRITIQMPTPHVPEGMEVERHWGESQVEGLYPVAPQLEQISMSVTYQYRIQMKGKTSPGDRFEGHLKQSVEWKRESAE